MLGAELGLGSTQRNVGIAEAIVTDDADEVLVTHALGSCIGVALFDPRKGVAGMVHCMLPLSRQNPARAAENPYYFTDTGVAELLQEMFDRGARRSRIIAKVAGAAAQNTDDMFRIGQRNHAVLRRVLWKNDILIATEDIGGRDHRTLLLDVRSGRTFVKKNDVLTEL